MSTTENSGIIGSVQAGNLAVGTNSSVTVIGQVSVTQELAHVREAIEGCGGEDAQRLQMLETHQELAVELDRPQPDKSTIVTKLTQLVETAGSASTVATAVTSLAAALQLVL